MQKKEKVKLGITVCLILVLLFAVINAGKKGKQGKPPRTSDIRRAQLEQGESKDLFKMMEEEGKNLELIRDPFTAAPIAPEKISDTGLRLNGILWDNAHSMVIINDTIVKIGDKINGNTVVNIKPEKVILNDGNHNFELRLEYQ